MLTKFPMSWKREVVPSLPEWLIQQLLPDQSGQVQTRLRGNILHVLCETDAPLVQGEALGRLVAALLQPRQREVLTQAYPQVYQLYVYSRQRGQSDPDWTTPVFLNRLERHQLQWPIPHGATSLGGAAADQPRSGEAAPRSEGAASPGAIAAAIPGQDTPEPTTPGYRARAGESSAAVSHPDASPAESSPAESSPPAAQFQPESSPSSPLLPGETAPDRSHLGAARQGQPEAIAWYLSEVLSALNLGLEITVRAVSGKAKVSSEPGGTPGTQVIPRLWIFCDATDSPDPALIAEPITTRLRQLELTQFRDAVVVMQVQGADQPDWSLRVDLTPPAHLLAAWGRWGDEVAIAHLLQTAVAPVDLTLEVKDATLHILVQRQPSGHSIPDQAATMAAIAPLLTKLAPQGRHRAMVYGQAPGATSPSWMECLSLPGADQPQRAESPVTLAHQGNLAALGFLLTRHLNPDLGVYLTTGGLRVQVRQRQNRLHIMVDGPLCPPRRQVVSAALAVVRQVQPQGLQGLRLYGRRAGQARPEWHYGHDLPPHSQGLSAPQELEAPPSSAPEPEGPTARLEPPLEALPAQLELLPLKTLSSPSPLAAASWAGEPAAASLAEEPSAALATRNGHRDGYQGELFPLTDLESEAPPSPSPLERQWHGALALLRQGLLVSQCFTPQVELPRALPAVPERDRRNALTIGVLWGLVGILATVQADWLLGQVFNPEGANAEAIAPAGIAGSPEAMPPEDDLLTALSDLDWNSGEDGEAAGAGAEPESEDGAEDFINGDVAPGSPRNGAAVTAPGQTPGQRDRRLGIGAIAGLASPYPSFRSEQMDEKVALYHQRLEDSGPPDILIIGSSRALRGVDPAALRQELAALGYGDLDVFNFGVNGSTAQVVEFTLRQVLRPDQLPRVILWADGARALNSGRLDITYNGIASSAGYRHLAALEAERGEADPTAPPVEELFPEADPSLRASYQVLDTSLSDRLGEFFALYDHRQEAKTLVRDRLLSPLLAPLGRFSPGDSDLGGPSTSDMPLPADSRIDFDGFLAMDIRFNPATYYQLYARVSGFYDSDYEDFSLVGPQTQALKRLIQFSQDQGIPLVFVNTPLTDEYLDSYRGDAEAAFVQFMLQLSATERGFIFRDLGQVWPQRYDYFSDPSHLNRFGAYQVSSQLAQDAMISWPRQSDSEGSTTP